MYISEAVRTFARKLGVDLTPTQWEKLNVYRCLVESWNRGLNLVRYGSEEELWRRHILESLILIPEIRESRLVDLGSGAGFTSIPIAICMKHLHFTGIESSQKRCVFLRRAVRELQLPYEVIHDRLEQWFHNNVVRDTLIVCRALPAWKCFLPKVLPEVKGTSRLALFGGKDLPDAEALLQNVARREKTISIPDAEHSRVMLLKIVSRETL